MTIAFYRRPGDAPPVPAEAPPGMHVSTWLPARDGYPKDGVAAWPNAIWWAFDKLGIFRNHYSGVLSIRDGDRVAHRSLVTAPWYRFPDMDRLDLQIGDVWTDPHYRGRGLATQAIGLILDRWQGHFASIWYIVDETNIASIRVIEKSGFNLAGRGCRTEPLMLRPLGRFLMSCER